MQAIVHIGMSKTGSTALQRRLQGSDPQMRRRILEGLAPSARAADDDRRAWLAGLRDPGGRATPGPPAAARPPDQLAPDQLRPNQLRPNQLRPDQLRPDRLWRGEPGPDDRVPDDRAVPPGMRTLLHIGMAKTGSSALQQALLRSDAALAARGVLYPQNPPGIGYVSHKLLLAALFDWRGTRTERLPAGERPPSLQHVGRAFLADLRGRVAATAPRCLILSTESLFRILPGAARADLPALLAELGGATTVIAYLRRPSERYVSRLQQHLKASYRSPGAALPKYRKVLEDYAGILGADTLALNVYHRPALAEGDIVADFATKYLAPYGVTRAELAVPERTNDTLSAESADISRRFRLAFHRDRDNRWSPDSKKLVEALRAADAATGAARPRLRPGVADRIDYACRDLLWLRDRHGVVFPDFDYRRLEKAPLRPPEMAAFALEDILEIDRGRARAILAALRAAPWAARRGKRRAWIDGLMAELA